MGRFWMVARRVCLMCRVCRVLITCCSSCNTLEIITPQPAGEVVVQGKNLAFDPNYFRMKAARIPHRLVELMQKLPEWRSEEDVLQLHKLMSSMDIFRRYSNMLQFLIARVVRYQRLGRRRVVLRRGHASHSFYFVWSGSLAMTKHDDGTSALVDKEPVLIKTGVSFGDIALIKGSRRNTTVVCVEETELLVIDKEDFCRNHIDLELKKEFEHHFSFFRSLELFSSWSSGMIELMMDHSKAERFRFGHIVDKHINAESSNIVFITEGQCDVLRVVDLTSCSSYQCLVRQLRDTGLHGNRDNDHEEKSVSRNKWSHSMPRPPLKAPPSNLPKSACFLIDSMHQGSAFGLGDWLLPLRQRDQRHFTLLSQGVQVQRVEKSIFNELVDSTTLKKLEALQKTYPSDEELCKFFLEHKRWQDYKQRLVKDLPSCHVPGEHVTQPPFRVTRELRTPQFW